MHKNDAVFLLCVMVCAALFAARSISQSVPLLIGGSLSAPATLGAGGQPRRVDMMKLERLLEEGLLSDHEAEFYEPAAPTARSGEPPPGELMTPYERDKGRAHEGKAGGLEPP